MKRYFLLFLILLFVPFVAMATSHLLELNLEYPSFVGFDLNERQSLNEIVAWFYYLIVGISGLAAFVMLVWGGIQWLSSAGSPGQITDAKDRIQKALLGLLLVLGSFLILQIINPEFTILRDPGLTKANIPSGGTGGGECKRSLLKECSKPENFSVFGAQTENAQLICQQESGGRVADMNRGCFLSGDKNSCELSVGLLQYNLVDRCTGLVTGTVTSSGGILRCTCEVPDQNALIALNGCLSNSGTPWRAKFVSGPGGDIEFNLAAANITRQVQRAFEVFDAECGSGQGDWSPWSTRAQCGITASCLSY